MNVLCPNLFNDSQLTIIPAWTHVEDRLLGLNGGNEAVVSGVKRLEGCLVLGLLLQLLLQVDPEDDVSSRVKHHLGLVQLRNCSQKMECPDVPDLSVGDDLQTVGMKDSA